MKRGLFVREIVEGFENDRLVYLNEQ
jgi:hypothetical protein